MKDNLDIDKLFKEKFEQFEPNVNHEVWQNIASSVTAGAASGAASGGMALWLKGAIVGAVATLVGVGTWVYIDANDQNKTLNDETELNEPKLTIIVPENIVLNTNETVSSNNPSEIVAGETLMLDSNQETIEKTGSIEQSNASLESVEINVDITAHLALNTEPIQTSSSDDLAVKIHENQPKVDEPVVDNTVRQNNQNDIKKHQEEPVVKHGNDPVNVLDEPSDKKEEANLSFIDEVPNVITPNGDRINDVFFIKSEHLASFYIVIYTTGNVKIFESYQADFKWDGFDLGGNAVTKGKYYYLIKAEGEDDESYSIPGQIFVK